MTCDAYYETHPPFEGPQSRRCSRPEIDSATATQVSILGMSTSLCGIINLILCGAFIKRFGTKWGFISQTGVLAIRVSCQVLSVAVGGRAGIIWMQATQLIGIIGGPRGYMSVAPCPTILISTNWVLLCLHSSQARAEYSRLRSSPQTRTYGRFWET